MIHRVRCTAVALLLLYPLVPESPHWLAVSGDAAGADAVLRRMAAFNGAQLPPGRLEGPPGSSANSAGGELARPMFLDRVSTGPKIVVSPPCPVAPQPSGCQPPAWV